MLKGGIIGCGFFAANHLAAWQLIDGAAIVAVCDQDPARARAAGAAGDGARVFDDAATMLASEALDFVDIITTAPSHRPLVELAARHRVPVICQKPFAPTLDDARAMVDACAQAGVPLMVHENFRWQSPLMAVKNIVSSGEIGEPAYARISFRHAYDIYTNQPYLKTEPQLAIMDLGIHLLDLARYFLGEATRLHCRTQRVNPAVAGEDCVTILLDHAGGAVSLVDFSFFTKLEPDPFPQTLVRIEGTKGTVELLAGYHLRVSGPGWSREEDVEPAVPAFGAKPWHNIQESVVNIQRHWIECLQNDREPATSGADNLKTIDLVFRAYESAATGRAS
ncbi:MAG: Gfo/Idh/MocA family oxidoreductase [Geminicoccaceae bacterium]|jgi:predicted dehydrogenase|nr:Gfo/Idh/MocA family oxidoreductase [Geminicoccaceae bacterium]MCB9969017.1 Gfo/Idh/MocA family oxidoreductase [Geminicoccaceae bacterium]HRY25033.1 Gfo/Idh/MocA family oxidoreductase [Geminicoccaceae bacterium]